MKLRSTLILAVAVAAPIFTGFALNTNSQASFANESQDKTEFQKRPGRWKDLSPEEREAKRAEKAAKMKQLLGLSDTQASRIESIREQYKPQRDALRQEAEALRESGDREGMQELRGRKKELKQTVKGEIKKVLTPEQIEKLEQHKAQRKGRRGSKRSADS